MPRDSESNGATEESADYASYFCLFTTAKNVLFPVALQIVSPCTHSEKDPCTGECLKKNKKIKKKSKIFNLHATKELTRIPREQGKISFFHASNCSDDSGKPPVYESNFNEHQTKKNLPASYSNTR